MQSGRIHLVRTAMPTLIRAGMARTLPMALSVAAAVGLNVASAQAGPCTEQIAQIEQTAHGPSPNAVPIASQSVGAQLHRQPTPGSVKQAEEQTNAAFDEALTHAKALDAAGKRDECMESGRPIEDLAGRPISAGLEHVSVGSIH